MDSNISGMCPVCSEERRLSWQAHHRSLKIEVGDFVKIRFRFNTDFEWMWVEVTGVLGVDSNDKERGMVFQGELRNDSVFDPNWSYGTSLGLHRSDIADYCKGGDFDNYDPWMPHGNILHEQHE